MKLIYLKSALTSDSFDVSIGIKIPFFRVSVTIEPGRSLLTVNYQELFDTTKINEAVHLLNLFITQRHLYLFLALVTWSS